MTMNDNQTGLPWYACNGAETDIIVSTRIRFARNLANFPFPECFKGDDYFRVQSLIFDSFAQLQNNESALRFHAIETSSLDSAGRSILEERGVLDKIKKQGDTELLPETGVVMTLDGCCSTVINHGDHVKISCFQAGLSCRKCFDECYKIDAGLQNTLQFAASYDFGYLTARLADCGSGMKISSRIHIPASVRFGKLNLITEIAKENGLALNPAFPLLSQGSVAGNFFILETVSASNGSELDQIAVFESTCRQIAETERKISREYADNKRTVIRNSVIRAYSIARFSLLVSLREAVDIISDLKTGLRLGFLTGIEDSMLNGLLYRIQPGHLAYLLESGNFSFEEDILDDQRARIDRIRSLILQEAFEKISLEKL